MKIGKEIEVSMLSLGTWGIGGGSWWGDVDDQISIQTIRTALEQGINFIDTAPVYGFGHSEKIVGQAIAKHRSEVVLSTKCGIWFDDDEGSYFFSRDGHTIYKNLSKRGIKLGVESSLKNLQTDYIDILYTHFQSVEPCYTPTEEIMGTLNELKKEGKIRAIGASNVAPRHIEEYMRYGTLDIIQEKYSLLDRVIEKEIMPCAKKNNVAMQLFSALEKGLLAGKFEKNYRPNKDSARDNEIFYEPERLNKIIEATHTWEEMCKAHHCSKAQLAIGWVLNKHIDVNVLCGARQPGQVLDNLKSVDLRLSEDEINLLESSLVDVAVR